MFPCRLVVGLFLSLILSGCVLQSDKPNFTDAEGVALPAEFVTTFVTENFTDGAWKAEEGSISLAASEQHYVATNEKSETIDVLFVGLGKDAWVMQAREKDKPFAYVLVEAKDDALLLRPLFCDDVKKQKAAMSLVRFETSDCFLTGSVVVDVFRTLGADVGDAKMRLRVVK